MSENKRTNLDKYKNPLMNYLPGYYDISPEEHYITFAVTPEVADLWIGVKQLKDNQFILRADIKTLKKWERLLKISPSDISKDIDYLRSIIIIKLSTRAPLTYRWLIEKLEQSVGIGNFYVALKHHDYELMICLTNGGLSMYQELKPYFRENIPANLTLLAATEMNQEEECILTFGGGAFRGITTDTLPVRDDEYNFNEGFYIRSGMLPGFGITYLPHIMDRDIHNLEIYLTSQVYTLSTTKLKEVE